MSCWTVSSKRRFAGFGWCVAVTALGVTSFCSVAFGQANGDGEPAQPAPAAQPAERDPAAGNPAPVTRRAAPRVAAKPQPKAEPKGTPAPVAPPAPPAAAPEAAAAPPPPPPPLPPPPPPPLPTEPQAAEHGQVEPGVPSGHGAEHAEHHAEEPPTFGDINWYQGLIGESDEEEPGLLYRPKGMPTPFLATLINWGILVWLIYALARKQLPLALAKRKASIVAGMQESQKLRDESAERLHEYEEKLARIDRDIERLKDEMRKAGEQERERILAEAVERRTRMERDARRLIETEIEAAKEQLRRELVGSAMKAAKETIETQVAGSDQQRLFDDAISSLKRLPPRSLGGQA